MSCNFTKNSSSFYGLLLAVAFTFFSVNTMADTASQDFSTTGYDDDPTVLTVNASDITVNNGGEISAVTLSSASLGSSFYCGSWYDFTLVVDGETVVANGCASDMESVDLTGFTSFSITSTDSDVYGDFITMSVGLSVDFTPLAGSGCTDMSACNYDSTASIDDESCTYAAVGFDCDGLCLGGGDAVEITFTDNGVYDSECSWSITDADGNIVASAGNQSGSATTEHCFDLVSGCFTLNLYDAYSDGWGGSAGLNHTLTVGGSEYTFAPYTGTPVPGAPSNADNLFTHTIGGGCVVGCSDTTAENYNADADITDDTLCEYALVQGCTDADACNYDELAEQDNGSCTYAAEGFDCEGSCLSGTYVVYSSGGYAGENSFLISDCDGNELASMSSGYIGFDGCVELTEDFQITLTDSWGDTWNGGSLTVGDVTYDGDDLFVGAGGNVSESVTYIVGSCGVPGCTDMAACNYDSTATFDDGSCTFAAEGYDCEGNCLEGVSAPFDMESLWYNDGFYGATYTITNTSDGEVVATGPSNTGYWTYSTDDYCMPAGCYEVNVTSNNWDSYDYNWYFGDASGPTGSSGFANIGGEDLCPSGCTDPLANNFDIDALVDDGSCVVCVDGVEVSSSELADGELPDDIAVVTINTGTDWSGEIHWEIRDDSSEDVILSGGNSIEYGGTSGDYDDNSTYVTTSGCLPDGCYKLITYDTYGDGWNGNGTFAVANQFGAELIPSTVMGPNSGNNIEEVNNDGYSQPYQELATYFEVGEGLCDTYGCTDEAASNYDADATVEDESCIYCEDGEVDVTFSFNQENITTDEVYVYNETDTVFSVEPYELGLWDGKTAFICVPVGCYTISMGSSSNGGWTDGSQLQVLDDLTDDYYFLDVEDATVDMTIISIGGAVCEDNLVGGCTDSAYDNYNPDATFDNNSCAFLCENATAGNTSNAVAGEDDTFGPWHYVTADAEGNGAIVSFEELAEGVSFSYIAYNLDSCNGNAFPSNINNLSIDLDAGQSLYFQAQNPYNYVDSVTTIFADLFEIPDTSLWGCMDEMACNYDSVATYQPDAACSYPLAGLDCDGADLPSYMDVELDFSGSFDLCADNNDYDATNSPYGGSSFYVNGPDMAFAFVGDGSTVSSEVTTYDQGYNYAVVHIYEGNPTDSASVLVDYDQLSGSAGLESNIMFDTDSGSTYFVVVDTYTSSYCYDFDITLTALYGVGGCTDSLACNFDAAADFDNNTCFFALEGFDCDNNFTGSACGTDDALTDSIVVGTGYANNMYEVYVYPSDGVTPVSILWTSGDTENNYDEFAIYDGVGEDAINSANLITEIEDNLPNQYVSGLGNGLTVLWSTDGSVNGDETFGNLVWEVYCAYVVTGCTDTLAVNFDADANYNDGSCEYDIVFGCTDMSAINYNADAEADDGSCLTQGTFVTLPYEGLDLSNCGNGDNLDESNTSYNSWYLGGEDALYMFSVADSGSVNIDLSNVSNSYSGIVVFDGNPLLGSDVVAFSTSSSTDESIVSMPVDTGITYYVVVDTWPWPYCIDFDLAIYADVFGCMDANADNYNADATVDDGSCEFSLVQGCMDSTACNYNELAEQDNGTCEFAVEGFDCDGICLEGSHVFFDTEGGYSYDGYSNFEITTCDGEVLAEMTNGLNGFDACVVLPENYVVNLTTDFQNDFTNYWAGSVTIDSVTYTIDPLNMSGAEQTFVGSCGVIGCTDELASNYDSLATYNDGSCVYPLYIDVELDFSGSFDLCANSNDFDATNTPYEGSSFYVNGPDMAFTFVSDGSSVSSEVTTYDQGFNYAVVHIYEGHPSSPDSAVAVDYDQLSGSDGLESNIIFDTDSGSTYFVIVDTYTSSYCYDFDITLTALSGVGGCTDSLACNFDAAANYDDFSCVFPLDGFDCNDNFIGSACGTDNVITDSIVVGTGYANNMYEVYVYPSDGVTPVSILWTSGDTENNYDEFAIYDGVGEDAINSANLITEIEDNLPNQYVSGLGNGLTVLWSTDGSVNGDETFGNLVWEVYCANYIWGCTDALATNYDSTAYYDDGSCEYDFVWGCIDSTACNYSDSADVDDGSCTYADAGYDCNGDCLADTDEDGICDDNEIAGCTDATALNYDATATDDDGSCEFCTDNNTLLVMEDDYFYGGWDGATFSMTDGTNSFSASLNDGGSGTYDEEYLCIPTGCYEVTVGGGYYDYEITFSLGDILVDQLAGTYTDVAVGATEDFDPCAVYGCMDATAVNYNPDANTDDGSCTLTMTTSVCGNPSSVMFTGPWWNWSVNGGPTAVDNGDGTWTFSLPNMTVAMEYLLVVDGTQENLLGSDYSCTPVTDGSNYANRQWTPADGYTITNVFGTCEDPSTYECPTTIAGCMDSLANNYNAEAEEDNGSCLYNITFNVDMRCHGDFNNVLWVSEWTGWVNSGWNFMSDDDGDGIYSFYIENVPFGHNYKYEVDGVQEDLMGLACAPSTDGVNYANRVVSSVEIADVFGSCDACDPVVLGCTDASADNFDPNANEDDGSCSYCSSFEAVLIGTSDASAAGASDGSVQATGQGGSNNYSISVEDADGVEQNPFALAAGDYFVVVTDEVSGCIDMEAFTISEPTVGEDPCDVVPTGLFVDNIIHNRVTFNWSAPSAAPSHYMIRYREVGTSSWTVMTAGPVNSNEFTGTSRTRYFMEAGTTYEWSMRARVLNEDGSTNCQSSWSSNSEYTTLDACANLENLSVDNVEANWVTFYADAPAAEWGVWQSKGKMRVVGTNAYRYVNGDSDGTISGVLKGNFTASTDYEWHTKSWCTGNVDANGDSDPQYHSGWGDFSSFTTEAPCDKMPTNLTTTSNGANTAVIMSWDTPASGAPDHYFLEMTNLTTGDVYEWNYQDGNSNSRTKFGQNPGDEISWRIRGACGTNGTSWATIFSQPVTYTLGGARLENSSVANLDVYPNPSRDIFNVTFTSEEAQTMTVKVVNMIGEEIFTEELTEFVGQYTQVIDMNTQPKGVYFLEITTSTGGINKKIVLQ